MARARATAPFRQTETEHREIRGLAKELRALLKEIPAEPGREAARHWGAVSDHLFSLRDRLVLHFAQEEQAGLSEVFEELQPHIADRSENLKAQHVRLLKELKAIYDASLLHAGSSAPQGPDLRKWVLDFLGQLARHEEKENDLIQRAYLEELGTGD